MNSPTFTMSLLSLIIFSNICFIAEAQVPTNQTFKFFNRGKFEDPLQGYKPFPNYSLAQYDATYRVLNVSNYPFQLCFYNTTPNTFTLALRMGNFFKYSKPPLRWVWEANRRNPVGENATLTVGTDSNLVLTDADGRVRVAWQTNTENKGVVGLNLLPTGNMVLYNSMTKGNFIWQSFDYQQTLYW